jgi:hypothetical protein
MLQQQIVSEKDDKRTQEVITDAFIRMTTLLSTPFVTDEFDFSNNEYIDSIYALGEEVTNMKELRESKEGRGSQHALYINRTYFGIYSILNVLGAKVKTGQRNWKQPLMDYHLNN